MHTIDVEKARKEMAEKGLDALIAASLPNVFYCTGYYSFIWRLIRDEIRLAVIPRNSAPFITCPDFEVASFEKGGIFKVYEYPTEIYYRYPAGVDDLYLKGRENVKELPGLQGLDVRDMLIKSPILLSAKILRDRGLSGAKIGLDKDYIESAVFEEIVTALPDAEILDATEIFLDLRKIKSDEELKDILEAIKITETAIETSIALTREGTYMMDLWQNVVNIMSKGPLSEPYGLIMRCSPLATGQVPGSLEGTLRTGQVFRWDVGAKYNHYAADIARQVAIGEIPNEQRDLYNILLGAEDAMVEKLRPGVKVCDVFNAGSEAVRKVDSGYERQQLLGHGIGIDQHEKPYITPYNQDTLEAGMVICVEAPHSTAGGYSYNYEDMYLITEGGHQLLSTRLSRELLVK